MNVPPPDSPPERFELVPLANGIHSLRSRANGQTFHPVVGPVAEARAVHVTGTRLVERANGLPAGERFVVWDVGLGAAANALTAFRALAEGYRRSEPVVLCSFDRTPAALDFALENREALAYPVGYESELAGLREQGNVLVPMSATSAPLRWFVRWGNFPDLLAGSTDDPPPHAIFYDPYSPMVNPEMWTLETFAALRKRTRPESPCLLTTYTRSTAVRVTLLLAGWFVGVGGATGEKDETTVAANALALLERPFTGNWLEKKVYASTNAAPLRIGSEGTRSPISEEDFERLRQHPQFAGG